MNVQHHQNLVQTNWIACSDTLFSLKRSSSALMEIREGFIDRLRKGLGVARALSNWQKFYIELFSWRDFEKKKFFS